MQILIYQDSDLSITNSNFIFLQSTTKYCSFLPSGMHAFHTFQKCYCLACSLGSIRRVTDWPESTLLLRYLKATSVLTSWFAALKPGKRTWYSSQKLCSERELYLHCKIFLKRGNTIKESIFACSLPTMPIFSCILHILFKIGRKQLQALNRHYWCHHGRKWFWE